MTNLAGIILAVTFLLVEIIQLVSKDPGCIHPYPGFPGTNSYPFLSCFSFLSLRFVGEPSLRQIVVEPIVVDADCKT